MSFKTPASKRASIALGRLDLASLKALLLERLKPEGSTGPRIGHSSVGRLCPRELKARESSDKERVLMAAPRKQEKGFDGIWTSAA